MPQRKIKKRGKKRKQRRKGKKMDKKKIDIKKGKKKIYLVSTEISMLKGTGSSVEVGDEGLSGRGGNAGRRRTTGEDSGVGT